MVALARVKSERKIGVDVAEADGAVDRTESDFAVIALVFAKDPTAIGLTGEVFNTYYVCVHQNVFT
jgi:hypothetical protein